MFGKKKEKVPEKQILVQLNMTRADVISHGMNKAMKRSWQRTMLSMLVILFVTMIATFTRLDWLAMVCGIGLAVYMGAWYLKCLAAGKRLWLSVQDKPEPIELM